MDLDFVVVIISSILIFHIARCEEVPCGKSLTFTGTFLIGARNDQENNPVGYWPWISSLGFNDKDQVWNHKCGATLISDRHFLTAAHCANDKWKLRLGSQNLAISEDAVFVNITKVSQHPLYDNKSSYFDVAVLEVEPLQLSETLSPICLPEEESLDVDKYDNHFSHLIGWGTSDIYTKPSKLLKRISLQIFSQSDCNETHEETKKTKEIIRRMLPNLFQSHIFCAGIDIGRQGSCFGDSGGPLMMFKRRKQQWFQIGTVQGGVRGCGDIDYPGLFIRLDDPQVFSFISAILKKDTPSKADNPQDDIVLKNQDCGLKHLGQSSAFPWACFVLTLDNSFVTTCTLIPNAGACQESRVITSATTFFKMNPSVKLKVRVSSGNKIRAIHNKFSFQDFDVKLKKVHPDFSPIKLTNNIAVLILNETLEFTPACLPSPNDSFVSRSQTDRAMNCSFVTWNVDDWSLDFYQEENSVNIVNFEQCNKLETASQQGSRSSGGGIRQWTINGVNSEEICIIGTSSANPFPEEERDAPLFCQVDSGGWKVVGLSVVEKGIRRFSDEKYGVITNVNTYLSSPNFLYSAGCKSIDIW